MAANGNDLVVGQSRIGLMIDGLPETPRVAVKLERTQDRVEVTIPFLDGHDDVYQFWFSGGIHYGDDPHRTKRRYKPPNSITFYDASGAVGLIGSRVSGSRITLGGANVGEGRLAFDYAVCGARLASVYESINGLRSEVEGLGTWIGLRSLDAEQEVRDGRLVAVNLRLQSSPGIRVSRKLNAEFQSNWRYGPRPGPDQTTITERMQVHTQVKRPVSWDDHLGVHVGLRNLLRVAAWRELNFVSHEAHSSADPLRTVDRKARAGRWLPVVTYRTGIRDTPTKLTRNDFLFHYGDVGTRGVGRWLGLSARFERALTPFVGLLSLEGASLEARLAQIGIGFEMLGYDLLIEAGASKTKAKDASFVGQVGAIIRTVEDVLPFTVAEFADLLRRTYVSVKHADKARSESLEMYLVYRQAIQVFRAWVALRIGVPKTRLKERLERDPVTHHIHQMAREVAQTA